MNGVKFEFLGSCETSCWSFFFDQTGRPRPRRRLSEDRCNGLDPTDENLIIVYGIQRTDVKNCFSEKASCDPLDRAGGGQKSSHFGGILRIFAGLSGVGR